MLQVLESVNNSNEKIKLGINWLFEPSINFYIKTKKLKWIEKVNRDGVNDIQDYYYIFENDTSILKNINYTLVYKFENTNTILLKRNKALPK
ncbi:MAG: hypothetical protein AB7S48_04315 [Bacteroidales bacterium]